MVSASVLRAVFGALFVAENHNNNTVQISRNILSGTNNNANNTNPVKNILQKSFNSLGFDDLFSTDVLFDEDELSTIARNSGNAHVSHSSSGSVLDAVFGNGELGNDGNSLLNFFSNEPQDLTRKFGNDLLLNQTPKTKQIHSVSESLSHFSAFSASPSYSSGIAETPADNGITVTTGNAGTAAVTTTYFSSETFQSVVYSQTTLAGNFTENNTQSYSSSSYNNGGILTYAEIEGGAYTTFGYDSDGGVTVISDTAYVFQTSNGIANVRANIEGGLVEGSGDVWSIEILDPGTYWSSTFVSSNEMGHSDYMDGANFTWSKPVGLANSDSTIDRDFTFRFTVGNLDTVDLNVHIAWAEVEVQFAGEGGFKHTSSTDTQSAGNTVVVGQKVEATLDYDPTVTLLSETWSAPTGGNFVKNYVTTTNTGTVTNHTSSDYTANTFDFYYTNKTGTSSTVRKISNASVFADPNGKSHGINRDASYYLETPTVVNYTSEWASWPSAPNELPTGIRPSQTGNSEILMLGGLVNGTSRPGITWTANVTAPPIIGGGQIAFNQLINGTFLRYVEGNTSPSGKNSYTNGNYMLDDEFPYVNPVSVLNTLTSNDSPGVPLVRTSSSPYNKYTASFSFQTYLIYKPTGTNTIWVTLSVISWGWNATAVYQYNTQSGQWKWEASGNTTGGSSTPTTILPTWSGNIIENGDHYWITI
jgi:hypothetical protein